MNYGVRYLLHRNGEVTKVPTSKLARFMDGEDGVFAEYAGEVLDFAEYHVQTEGRRVVRILRRLYMRAAVTSTGSIDLKAKMAGLRQAVDRLPSRCFGVRESGENRQEAPPGPEPEWRASPELQRRMDAVVLGLAGGRRRNKR